jgi:hypothetical protein
MSCRISLHFPIDQTAFKDSKAGCFRPLLLGISPDSRLDVIIVTSGFFTDPEPNKRAVCSTSTPERLCGEWHANCIDCVRPGESFVALIFPGQYQLRNRPIGGRK